MRMSNKAKAFFEKAKQTEKYWFSKAKMDFSVELARKAAEANLNGKSLADALGTSPAYISKVFRGDTNLTIESMVKLARATGAQVEIKLSKQAQARVNTETTVTYSVEKIMPAGHLIHSRRVVLPQIDYLSTGGEFFVPTNYQEKLAA